MHAELTGRIRYRRLDIGRGDAADGILGVVPGVSTDQLNEIGLAPRRIRGSPERFVVYAAAGHLDGLPQRCRGLRRPQIADLMAVAPLQERAGVARQQPVLKIRQSRSHEGDWSLLWA